MLNLLQSLFVCFLHILKDFNNDALVCVGVSKHFLVVWNLPHVAKSKTENMQKRLALWISGVSITTDTSTATDRQTNGRMDRQTDRQTVNSSNF